MEFINKTPLPAELSIGKVEGTNSRIGLAVAKATFVVADGRVTHDSDTPYPIFPGDEETPLGLLPRDDLPKTEGFDVMVLGKAYAPGGKPAANVTISLTLGNLKRTLLVFGNRVWKNQTAFSPPEPFEIMPMTYANAFGGNTEIEIDKDSYVTANDSRNPAGKGFDVEPHVESLSAVFTPPQGYPRFSETRHLPNIEHPDDLIRSWKDSPDPACWATMPLTSAVHAQRSFDTEDDSFDMMPGIYCRANPTLALKELEPGADINLDGMRPEGGFRFKLPEWRVFMEFLLDDRHFEREMRADTLMILPEEKRFYIVYRLLFNYDFIPNETRAARLKVVPQPV